MNEKTIKKERKLPPLTEKERLMLLELVESHKVEIFCKDGKAVKRKQQAWQQLTNMKN